MAQAACATAESTADGGEGEGGETQEGRGDPPSKRGVRATASSSCGLAKTVRRTSWLLLGEGAEGERAEQPSGVAAREADGCGGNDGGTAGEDHTASSSASNPSVATRSGTSSTIRTGIDAENAELLGTPGPSGIGEVMILNCRKATINVDLPCLPS